uniref:Sin3a_C domain-containing protein n=1 Tax=Ascaris lumbricoides TaxID=6252 RepID=A0A0M3IKA8_ASCLU
MLSSFGIRFSDEAAVTAAELADRNIREICAKNARGVELPSTSQDLVTLDGETKKTNGKPSTESKDQPSRSLFDLFHSAVANTYNLLTGGYYGTTAACDSEHDKTPISDSANITLDDTGRKVQFVSSKREKISHENGYHIEDSEEDSLDAPSLQEAQRWFVYNRREKTSHENGYHIEDNEEDSLDAPSLQEAQRWFVYNVRIVKEIHHLNPQQQIKLQNALVFIL